MFSRVSLAFLAGVPLRFFAKLVAALNTLGSAWILALTALINADIFGRFLFSNPVSGVPELVQMSIVGIVYLQLGHTVRVGRITRSDGLFNALLRCRPKTANALGALYSVSGGGLFLLIAWSSWPRFAKAWEEGYYFGNPGVFVAPTWPILLIIVIGCAVTALQFAHIGARYLLAVRGADRAVFDAEENLR